MQQHVILLSIIQQFSETLLSTYLGYVFHIRGKAVKFLNILSSVAHDGINNEKEMNKQKQSLSAHQLLGNGLRIL